MHKAVLAMAALAAAAASPCAPASAVVARSDSALAGRTICWWSGWDSEQYGRDHSYVYSYHVHIWTPYQYVVRGTWSIGADGAVTLSMDGGGKLIRKYDLDGNRVVELTGSLDGGAEGYFC